jgi:hypothetical protein
MLAATPRFVSWRIRTTSGVPPEQLVEHLPVRSLHMVVDEDRLDLVLP